jgi:hypothetical protein
MGTHIKKLCFASFDGLEAELLDLHSQEELGNEEMNYDPRFSCVRVGGISRRKRFTARFAEPVTGSNPVVTLLPASRREATELLSGDGLGPFAGASGRKLRTVSSAP